MVRFMNAVGFFAIVGNALLVPFYLVLGEFGNALFHGAMLAVCLWAFRI